MQGSMQGGRYRSKRAIGRKSALRCAIEGATALQPCRQLRQVLFRHLEQALLCMSANRPDKNFWTISPLNDMFIAPGEQTRDRKFLNMLCRLAGSSRQRLNDSWREGVACAYIAFYRKQLAPPLFYRANVQVFHRICAKPG